MGCFIGGWPFPKHDLILSLTPGPFAFLSCFVAEENFQVEMSRGFLVG
jgi:hypothetical protein